MLQWQKLNGLQFVQLVTKEIIDFTPWKYTEKLNFKSIYKVLVEFAKMVWNYRHVFLKIIVAHLSRILNACWYYEISLINSTTVGE